MLVYKWVAVIVAGGGCSHKLTDIDGGIDIYSLLLYEWMNGIADTETIYPGNGDNRNREL